jgi:hypothetical protein
MPEAANLFPKEFADLERLRDWSLPGEVDRIGKRMESSDDEIRAFYDAMLPRMDDVYQYLNRFPLTDMPEDARRLFDVAKSFMEIANIAERGRSRIAWRFDVSRFVPMRLPGS